MSTIDSLNLRRRRRSRTNMLITSHCYVMNLRGTLVQHNFYDNVFHYVIIDLRRKRRYKPRTTPPTLTVHPTSTPQRITNGEEVTSTTASTGHFETCPPEFEGYCYEGTCKYIGEHPDPKQRISCSCPPWKRGPRCQHSDPDFSRKDSVERALLNSYVVIGTLVGLLVLVAIPAAAFFCRRSRPDRESNMDARNMREAGSSATLMEP
ncbi:probetacellulin-like isoform X2 [Branchiostoma lanceolatum]|uniref:probetacellulin-like isoform X2 n=1 Tax=Branchiostoma lanceolatum TaxID=7740 RepID=UPI0034540DFA